MLTAVVTGARTSACYAEHHSHTLVKSRMPTTRIAKNPPKNAGTGEPALDLIGNILELLSADSITGKDPQGKILLGNGGARRLCGSQPQEAVV